MDSEESGLGSDWGSEAEATWQGVIRSESVSESVSESESGSESGQRRSKRLKSKSQL
jgi:hypothetical protein